MKIITRGLKSLPNGQDELIQRLIDENLIEISDDRITYIIQDYEDDFSDPEEKVRAKAYARLVFHYDYPPERIFFEEEVPERPERYVDIVVYEEDELENVFIVGECKATSEISDLSVARRDGLGKANTFDSPFLYCPCGEVEEVYEVDEVSSIRNLNKFRRPTLPQRYEKPPKYTYKKNGEVDIQGADHDRLKKAFGKCHNAIWAGGKRDPADAFDEMSKLIFAKIFDELNTSNGEYYKFQKGREESEQTIGSRIRNRYQNARDQDPSIFEEEIKVDDAKIEKVVEALEDISLRKSDLDAKGRAFEEFLGATFRGELGQYFTRRELVDFFIDILKPEEEDFILDPACGSGGFLLYSLEKVRNQIERDYEGDADTIQRKKYDFAYNHLFGIEINEKIARVAMMDMSIHNDAHTNIENNTALDRNFRNPDIVHGEFSLILTNPPFGDNVEENDEDKLGDNELSNFELAQKASSGYREKEKSGILFLEACNNFLKENGRMGIVLSDGILSNRGYRYRQTRKFIKNNFNILGVVSLPSYAFNYAESGLRTSLVFLEKSSEEHSEEDIFMAMAENIGYDSTGRSDVNELPDFASAYNDEKELETDRVFWISHDDLEDRLDVMYYYLGPKIGSKLQDIPYDKETLEDITSEPIKSGSAPKGGLRRSSGEVPILCIGNMTKRGGINLEGKDIRTRLNHVPRGFFEDNKERAEVVEQDVLIAKDGATTGMVSIIPEDFELDECMINEHIFRVRIDDEEYVPKYVFAFLFSELGQLQIQREISGGAQTGITREFVENIEIPIPPRETQEELSEELLEGIEESRELRDQSEELFQNVKKEFSENLSESN